MRTAAAVLAFAALGLAGEENLIRNGGFEDGTAGWILYGFGREDSHEIVKKKAAAGRCALHVAKSGGDTYPRVWANYDLAADQREGKLSFAFRIKAKKLSRVTVEFLVYDTSDGIALKELAHPKPLKGTFRWKEYESTFDVPPNAKGGRIFLVMNGKGEFWLDDVRLTHEAPKGSGKPRQGRKDPLELDDRGWTKLPSPARTLKVGRTKGALRLERKGDRLHPLEGVEQIVRDVGKAKRITLRCRARTDGSARAVVALLAELESGGVVVCARREVDAAEFEDVVLKLERPRHAERLRVVLAVAGKGDVRFEDIRLEDR